MNFDVEKFSHLRMLKIAKNSKFRAAKMSKWQFLGLQIDQNWFHVKSDWQKNLEISTLWGVYVFLPLIYVTISDTTNYICRIPYRNVYKLATLFS